ncbi:helix-turn-helix domain-containing protein [Spirochaeta africana]|uniref:DNA-binding domain-containing protein, AraC-type n=1 Tax=Spirochaeta africana (strain ATCC 700263 / DSM 8902 / Z-7692) TaxID=889378 RepID=H9UIX3_SPIAZ|nr:helix-turn-helix domain-containing protein [Spirochaeta africana]AFG37466.1 DNA-binding domain-containing protein, AraC-type [Spirochaeta africana DSM 8902]
MKHSLYIRADRILMCGITRPHPEHRHAFAQIFTSTGSEPGSLDVQIIAPNCLHGLESGGDPYFSLLFDPSSEIGFLLRKHYLKSSDSPIIRISLPDPGFSLPGLVECSISSVLLDASDQLVRQLGCAPASAKIPRDDRIQRVVLRMQEPDGWGLSAAEAAQIACLSTSRFLAVFKQYTGLPYRNYLLMQKLIRGIHLLNRSASFTEAALAAGFSDSAHFTRTFTHSTGMNLKEVFKNSQFIQVFYDLPL